MAFRYINPGYVYLLDSNVTATQITGNEYSKTGVAFTQTGASAGATIPQFKQGDDFWAKFDVYIPPAGTGVKVCILPPNSGSYGFRMEIGSSETSDCFFYHRYSATDGRFFAQGKSSGLGLTRGAINSISLRFKFVSGQNGVIYVIIGNLVFSSEGKNYILPYYANEPKIAKIFADSTNVKFSNVIFSDSEISPKEQAIRLPISATATDMTAVANGVYAATAAGQTLLQTPDITALAQDFSGDSQITGIQVVGNPAYKKSTGLEKMIGLSKSGASTTEHNSFTLGTDSTAIITDGWALSDVTLNDLPNMAFGWKTAN